MKAWAILDEDGEPIAAWVGHSGALAEARGAPVVPCIISISDLDRRKYLVPHDWECQVFWVNGQKCKHGRPPKTGVKP